MKASIIIRGLAAAAALTLIACKKPAGDHAGHDHSAHEEGGSEKADFCGEHNLAEAECGICNPDKIATLKPGESLKLRLPSEKSTAMAGIETRAARSGNAEDGFECYAEFDFVRNQYARIGSPVSGVIREVTADLGSKVTEGQCVARIWSASVAEAVAKAVLTHQTLEREQKLRDQKVTSEKDLQQAEAEHRAACQAMRTLGFSEASIHEMADKPTDTVLIEARAPFAGEITDSTAVRGAMVEAGAPLFTVADRSVMSAELAVPENFLGQLREGQQVELTVVSLPDQKFTGKLTWISAELDEHTRMAKARAEVANPDGLIKARMFAKARVITSRSETAVIVPDSAIQRIDSKALIFVSIGKDLFEARAVRLGASSGDSRIIAEGLKTGEEVAVQHAFALRSQLLISRLGAGCAHD